MHPKLIAICSAALFGVAAAAQAAQQEGLVNVSLSNIQTEIAKDLNVNVSQIPVNAQLPIGIAANVCGVDANVLAKKEGGTAECTAKTTSKALNQQVQRQLVSQK